MMVKLLVWALLPVLNAWLDRKGTKRNYLVVFGLRGMASIFHGIWMLSNKDLTFNYSNASSWELLMVWLPVLVFQASSYWLIFEIVLNILRHNPILYYDHQEGDSGYIDRFFKWAGPSAHFFAKMLCLLILVLSIVNLYHNGY